MLGLFILLKLFQHCLSSLVLQSDIREALWLLYELKSWVIRFDLDLLLIGGQSAFLAVEAVLLLFNF